MQIPYVCRILKKHYQPLIKAKPHANYDNLGPLLLTRFNFNPTMDK